MTVDFDVAVVGAGIAGLATATRLLDAGVTCTVLESQDRVGGRLLTHPSDAGPLELGATWFWPGEPRVAALVDELRIPTHAQHLEGDAMYHVPGGAQRIDGNPLDVPSRRFTPGAASLAERLAARLGSTVCLGASVQAVDHGCPEVAVAHARGTLRARHVVLALPAALAVHRIRFDPGLDQRLHALAESTPVWMGSIAKAVAVYEDAFWRRHGLSGAAISHVGPLREIHDMSGPHGEPAALFGFAPLPPGARTPTEQQLVDQLAEIFGAEATVPIEVVVKDWRHDPDAVPPTATSLTAMQTYADPRYQEPAGGGRIHWASTETSHDSPGHIEGALAAAERAVDAVVTQLREGR